MNRKVVRDLANIELDKQLNGQEYAKILAELEFKTMELANKIDSCNNKKLKKRLERKLEVMTQVALTIGTGNVSFMSH